MGAQDTDLVLRVKALKRGYHRKVSLDRSSDLLGAFVGWDAIFDLRSSIRSTDLGKHQCFRAELRAASILLKYHGVRLFSYDFKECHAWYHPGTPPQKNQFKMDVY